METKSRFFKIVEYISIAFHIIAGVVVFIFALQEFEIKPIILELLILLGCAPHFLLFISNYRRPIYLIIGLVPFVISIVAMATNCFDVDQICVIWGAIDICRGITEIYDSAPKLRKNKMELIDIAVSLGDIVIGVLLCIHVSHGLKLHLIYFAIAFLIIAIKNIVELFIIDKHE